MDVYTNALFKGAIKRARCMELFNYFQGWKLKRLQQMTLAADVRVFPAFDPPKPTLASGMQTAFKVCDEVFPTERYQSGMRNAFFQRCQFHDQDAIVHARHLASLLSETHGCPEALRKLELALGSWHQTWMLKCQQKKMWMRACPLRMRMQSEHLISLFVTGCMNA